MIKFIKELFSSKKPSVIPPTDSVWYIPGSSGNPFRKSITKVKVIAVKNGWINYKFLSGSIFFQNESMLVKTFLSIYFPSKE